MRLIARLSLPFRCQDESDKSVNRGLFRELTNILADRPNDDEMNEAAANNNNNNNFRVSNIRVSNRTLIYNVCPEAALT